MIVWAPKAPNEFAAVIKFFPPQFYTEISVSQCNPNQLNSSQPFPAALIAFHEVEDMKYQEQRIAGSLLLSQNLEGEFERWVIQWTATLSCVLSAGWACPGIFSGFRLTKHSTLDKPCPASRTIDSEGCTAQDPKYHKPKPLHNLLLLFTWMNHPFNIFYSGSNIVGCLSRIPRRNSQQNVYVSAYVEERERERETEVICVTQSLLI